MPTSVASCVIRGLEGHLVDVEVDHSPGQFAFQLVGLATGSVREARDRVRAAIRNNGLPWPAGRVTVNLAPAELRKEGSLLDLAIAVAVALAASGRRAPRDAAFLGELGLDGRLRHVAGVLVAARYLARLGVRQLFVPLADAAEAALAGDLLTVHGCPDLGAVIRHLTGEEPLAAHLPARPEAGCQPPGTEDLLEVQGQEAAKRALEVAAAGGHHLLLTGPPGAGKTMLARCLPSILPALSLAAAIELAEVRSVLGDLPAGSPIDWTPPFRSPHHSVSTAGLVGGGSHLARPGEVSRAHHGVLFLDELAEFEPAALQALRQPLEQGRVTVTRTGGAVSFPAQFQLVAASNPCPCGWAGDPFHSCRCSSGAIERHRRALSGPLLDRIDLQVPVTRPPLEALGHEPTGETSTVVRARVLIAQGLQLDRQGGLNSALSGKQLRHLVPLDREARRTLERWSRERGLSGRGFHRAWRVARTLADLDGGGQVESRHVMEALGYRLAAAA